MGNIPAKKEVIFVSEFIHYTEFSKTYEFELFRNLPIFKGKNYYFQNCDLRGKIEIQSQFEINNIRKEILMNNLSIIEEKYQDDKKKNYLISYKIDNLPKFSEYDLEYIPCSKIYFDIDNNKPIIYIQKSIFDNSFNYVFQYKIKANSQDLEKYPALFIFLIDQSGSMKGNPIQIVSEALKLALQSLPINSYYQLIGFGTNYKKYDRLLKSIMNLI